MRIVTLNVNGIRAASRKGFQGWATSVNFDILCLQEIRADAGILLGLLENLSGNIYYNLAEKAGYSGVAVLSRYKPKYIEQIKLNYLDNEGRFIMMHFNEFTLINCYLPSGSSSIERCQSKAILQNKFLYFLKNNFYKKLIICGDFNIAHTMLDIKNWRNNLKSSGFLANERAWLSAFKNDLNLVDSFRYYHPELPGYTWWSQRANAKKNDVGWRIDFQFVTEKISDLITNAFVMSEQNISDHAPVVVDYNMDILGGADD